MSQNLRAPFPYFGGKSRIAKLVWQRFGDVDHYIEPFFGSGAVLLARPQPGKTETVNDIDGLLTNFWRAVKYDPDAVAGWADWPVSELDLHARHEWLISNKRDITEQLRADPDWYDVKDAGWWVWGISQWIGGRWGSEYSIKKPELTGGGKGVHSLRYRTKTYGRLPAITSAYGGGIHSLAYREKQQEYDDLYDDNEDKYNPPVAHYLRMLSDRLRYVRIVCGDWSRVVSPSLFKSFSTVGVFLDPPYSHEMRNKGLYAEDHNVSDDVRQWAIEAGDNASLRIALCGLPQEHAMPPGWTMVKWRRAAAFNNARKGDEKLEDAVWFSPHCLKLDQLRLFE